MVVSSDRCYGKKFFYILLSFPWMQHSNQPQPGNRNQCLVDEIIKNSSRLALFGKTFISAELIAKATKYPNNCSQSRNTNEAHQLNAVSSKTFTWRNCFCQCKNIGDFRPGKVCFSERKPFVAITCICYIYRDIFVSDVKNQHAASNRHSPAWLGY